MASRVSKFVQRQEQVRIFGEGTGLIEQFEPDAVAAALSAVRAKRALSIRIRRIASAAATKKWPPVFPAKFVGRADQTKIHLVNEGRRLQRVIARVLGRPCRRQLSQLVVDEREKLRSGLASPALAASSNRVTSDMSPS